MTWEAFLQELSSHEQVAMVGPLLKTKFAPKGPTIYVDGGSKFRDRLDERQAHPEVSVGDGDSSDFPMDKVLPAKKDYSDLSYALRSLPPCIHHVDLLGFMGGRPDHQLINYGEVHHYLRNRTQFTTVRFDHQVLAFSHGGLSKELQGSFSVVVFEPTEITIKGFCKYPIFPAAILDPVSSKGLSNEGTGVVSFASHEPCFLFLS